MDATIDNQGEAAVDPDADDGSTLAVSADAVAIDGTPPEVGDTVTFTVEGTVASTDGTTLQVTPTKINDQDVPAPTAQPDEGDTLRSAAMSADSSQDY